MGIYALTVSDGTCAVTDEVEVIDNSPFITSSGSLSTFSACSGNASSEQNFTVSGSNLTSDITITAPTGYEVSTTSGSGFASSVTLVQSGGTVPSTTIYVRLSSSASNGASGNVACTSTGASTQNVATGSATINSPPIANAGSDVAHCSGSSSSLSASASGGSGGSYTYSWSPSTGLSATNVANPTASHTSTTTYTVTVTDGNGCIDTDDVVVIVAQEATAGGQINGAEHQCSEFNPVSL